MANYRVYLIGRHGKISSGHWVEAEDDGEAMRAAHALCDDEAPQVEVWQGSRRIAALPCDEDVNAT